MIRRGTSHVILSETELIQRVRKRATVKLLERLMWFYEDWSRRNLLISMDCEVTWDNSEEFLALMADTKRWLQPPLRLEFGNANKQRRNADADCSDSGDEVNLSKAERRRRRRQRRKNNLDGIRGGT